MKKSFYQYVFNQQFMVKYRSKNVQIYEITSLLKLNLLLKFKTTISITDIQFNPFVSNIILLSFDNGTCKIYNILDKSDKEKIIFESIKNGSILLSVFNTFNPNIIASINENNDIFIWDIRKLTFLNVIDNCDEIIKIKWSHYDSNFLEIQNDENEVRLVNIFS